MSCFQTGFQLIFDWFLLLKLLCQSNSVAQPITYPMYICRASYQSIYFRIMPVAKVTMRWIPANPVFMPVISVADYWELTDSSSRADNSSRHPELSSLHYKPHQRQFDRVAKWRIIDQWGIFDGNDLISFTGWNSGNYLRLVRCCGLFIVHHGPLLLLGTGYNHIKWVYHGWYGLISDTFAPVYIVCPFLFPMNCVTR